MELVSSRPHFLQIGMSRSFPVVILCALMLAANWGLGFVRPQFDITNPRPTFEAIRKSHEGKPVREFLSPFDQSNRMPSVLYISASNQQGALLCDSPRYLVC